MNNKINELFENETLTQELFSLEAPADVVAFLAKHDITVTEKDVELIKAGVEKRLNGSDELLDEDLENVAGGVSSDFINSIADKVCSVFSSLGDKVHGWTGGRW